jgi:hypothetical protein
MDVRIGQSVWVENRKDNEGNMAANGTIFSIVSYDEDGKPEVVFVRFSPTDTSEYFVGDMEWTDQYQGTWMIHEVQAVPEAK